MTYEIEIIEKYPSYIIKPLLAANEIDDSSGLHKALIDLGESILIYITGFMFGEYKRSGSIDEKIEAEFYKHSSRKSSFGVFLSFLRLLSQSLSISVISDKFDKSKNYPAVSEFVLMFDLLKKAVNEGKDDDFENEVNLLKQGRTVSRKGLLDFFNTFVMIRNIYAHPEDKAGPKKNKRKWPLGDDYFKFINPFMQKSINEIILDFSILKDYKPIYSKKIDDMNKRGCFILEVGEDMDELDMDLTPDDLEFISTNLCYLLDKNNNIYSKLYYNEIPQLNPLIAQKIINCEKAKVMEPVLVDMIKAKLDDKQIDRMELLVLKDTAKTSYISEEKLFQLIDQVKMELGIEGDLFIEEKEILVKPTFNAWWLNYFNMVGKIDAQVIKTEQSENAKFQKKIKKLKDQKKNLPIKKQINNNLEKLKKRKSVKRKTISSFESMISKSQKQKKKTTDIEKQHYLDEEIKQLQNNLKEKKAKLDAQIQELTKNQDELEVRKKEKETEIDMEIGKLEEQHNLSYSYNQWGMHRNLWNEITNYIGHIIDENLNIQIKASTEELNEIEEETSDKEWVNEPNAWQIGQLSYTYWARIYPKDSPLGMTFNVGIAISNGFKWSGKVRHSINKKRISLPSIIIWPTWDDKLLSKIDDGRLFERYQNLTSEMVQDYANELIRLDANIRCFNKSLNFWDTIPLEEYAADKEKFSIQNGLTSHDQADFGFRIFSKYWNIDDFMENDSLSTRKIRRFEKDMVTYIQLFSNIVIKINDYALEIGINKETINQRIDQVGRIQSILFLEFDKYHVEGTSFNLNADENETVFEFARDMGINRYLYDYLLSQYRFMKRGLNNK